MKVKEKSTPQHIYQPKLKLTIDNKSVDKV